MDQLCDEVIRRPLEQCDPAMFQALEPGDILFLDSSHRAFQGSDVTVFFTEILPRLKPGVIVQVHDIYLPDDYASGHLRPSCGTSSTYWRSRCCSGPNGSRSCSPAVGSVAIQR